MLPSSSSRRRLLLGVLGLALVVALTGAAFAVRRALDEAPAVPPNEPGPVLLVAGYGGSVRALTPLRKALVAQGRDVVVVPPVGDNTGDLDRQAEALDEAADRALARRDAP